jgi:predicted PhzF superfamily epimerase YddE/YHI9
MMRLRFIDAFTERTFTGNPAGVCTLEIDEWPNDTSMREVAIEPT